jgi:hypothetical protein
VGLEDLESGDQNLKPSPRNKEGRTNAVTGTEEAGNRNLRKLDAEAGT